MTGLALLTGVALPEPVFAGLAIELAEPPAAAAATSSLPLALGLRRKFSMAETVAVGPKRRAISLTLS